MARAWIAILALVGCEPSPPGPVRTSEAWDYADRVDLEVHVVDAAGAPVPGAWVTLSPPGRDRQATADGIAQFAAVDAHAAEALVSAPGFAPVRTAVAAGVDAVVIQLDATPRDGAIAGWVADPYGGPVAGASVWLDGIRAAETDDAGAYAIFEVPAGRHALRFEPPGEALAPWTAAGIETRLGTHTQVNAALPGAPPATAVHAGSATCLYCHAGTTGPGAAWSRSAHARATRSPAELAGTELAAAFTDGEAVSLGDSGARLLLAAATPTAWTATVVDAGGTSTGPLPVRAIYGGHRTGAAVAVDDGGERRLLPALFRLPDADPVADGSSWVPYRTEGWLDGTALRAVPTALVAFDLQCAGCHATGHRLDDTDGYALAPTNPRGAVEEGIGCEACHGPGSAHVARPAQGRRTIHNPARSPGSAALDVCARCHEARTADDHPFADPPGWPVTAAGSALPVGTDPDAHSTATPTRWASAPGARVGFDQVGDLRLGPHRQGPDGWDGSCSDCHDPHGSDHAAALRRPAHDNGLCTECHQSAFPSRAAAAAHAGHPVVEEPFGAGTCTGCHLPRSGHAVRPDALSGVGESHAHSLWPFLPADALAELDAATGPLAADALPGGACNDCHLHRGVAPSGDPASRATWEALDAATLWRSP